MKLDCFECHATKPESSAQLHPMVSPSMNSMRGTNQADSAELLARLATANQDSVGASK